MMKLVGLAALLGSAAALTAPRLNTRSMAARRASGMRMATVDAENKQESGVKLPDLGQIFNSLPSLSPGQLKIGNKRLVVVTGASSGLGKECARNLVERGDSFVIMACRDVKKAQAVADELRFNKNNYHIMELELSSLANVRQFVKNLKSYKGNKPLDVLVNNAAVYLPTDPTPAFSEDGYEMSVAVNHLGHFLLSNLLIDDMKKSKDPRCIIVGSITGNTNTIGGGFVYPRADLGKLQGLEKSISSEGGKGDFTTAMIDGKLFDGAKAYKDAKMCNMMTVTELHERYHKATGITFSSLYPGCIATTELFREKRGWFRVWFPWFQKYVTGGFVSEAEAGDRLAQVAVDEKCKKSDVYWSWNGNAQQLGLTLDEDGRPKGAGGSGGDIFENQQSNAVTDSIARKKMFDLSAKAVGLDM
uniref:protochlorophyllide reductase n=1 Tax=Phaeomonas parva TaxID=124430 RepID=A0A7S1TWC2_9STRA|mmetsp:Transcript_2100/g.6326  ORF Transcript_2100/g.6326 Transcript_2100/m.6326 type:complete len:417 (+) Transcript_2100:501-1751(+)